MPDSLCRGGRVMSPATRVMSLVTRVWASS